MQFFVIIILCFAAVISSQLEAEMDSLHNPPTQEFPAPKVGAREVEAERHKARVAMANSS